jgi:hypothetical protein
MASSKVTVVPFVRAGAVLALAALGFVAFVDVNFFAIVPSADAGRPDDGEG